MVGSIGYLPFKPTFFDATSRLSQYHATSATSSLLDVAFFVVFQVNTSKCDNKKQNTDMRVKGVKLALLFFLPVVVAKKIAAHTPPKICRNEIFRIQSPSNSYT